MVIVDAITYYPTSVLSLASSTFIGVPEIDRDIEIDRNDDGVGPTTIADSVKCQSRGRTLIPLYLIVLTCSWTPLLHAWLI